MAEAHWVVVAETAGIAQAEILGGLLEAQDIQVVLSKEGAGTAYGITVGPLGRVQILVPSWDSQRAMQVLNQYDAGLFEEDQEFPTSDAEAETGEDGLGEK